MVRWIVGCLYVYVCCFALLWCFGLYLCVYLITGLVACYVCGAGLIGYVYYADLILVGVDAVLV